MDIIEAIKVLEAEDFRLYRKILNSGDVIVGLLVLPTLDLYADVRRSDNGARVAFTGGKLDGDGIVDIAADDLNKQLRAVLYKARQHSIYYDKGEEKRDLYLLGQLAELEKETSRNFDRVWQGRDEYFKVLYRGVVIEINNKLEVLSLQGQELSPGDEPDPEDVRPDLVAMLNLIDESGGFTEKRVEVEDLEAQQ